MNTTTIHQPTTDEIMRLPLGAEFVSTSGIRLRVNQRTFAKGVELEDIANGAVPVEVVTTSDGRGYYPKWHVGPESDESVRVERYTSDGLAFHGFIDPTTRRIVQTG